MNEKMDYLYDLLDAYRGISKDNDKIENGISTQNDHDELEYETQRNITVNEFKQVIPEELSYSMYMIVGKLVIGQSIKIVDIDNVDNLDNMMESVLAHMKTYKSLGDFCTGRGMDFNTVLYTITTSLKQELKQTDGNINLKSLYNITQNCKGIYNVQMQTINDNDVDDINEVDSDEYAHMMYDKLNRHKYIINSESNENDVDDVYDDRENKKSRYE
jgi:hypothetical protein